MELPVGGKIKTEHIQRIKYRGVRIPMCRNSPPFIRHQVAVMKVLNSKQWAFYKQYGSLRMFRVRVDEHLAYRGEITLDENYDTIARILQVVFSI